MQDTRTQFHKIIHFQTPDRPLRIEWAPWWTETLAAWEQQGMPAALLRDAAEDPVVLQRHFGLDQVVQEWVHPLSAACPPPEAHGGALIGNREDYRKLMDAGLLYPPADGVRFDRFDRYGGADKREESIFWLTLDGFFWHPRTLFGIEGHLFAFYDHPELMKEMNQHAVDYYLQILERLSARHEIDFMTFAEDLSYNHGPMLSKEQFDEFIAPYYAQLIPVLKKHGIKVFIDSDGDISECVKWFLEAGADGILPLERAAGVDVAKLREQHPGLLMLGGFDKMIMHLGDAALRREFERLQPVVRQGGFLQSCDHQTPPSVSVEEYRRYLAIWAEDSYL